MNEKIKAKLKDIQEHPENHKHDFASLSACCTVDGVVDLMLIEAHSTYVDLGKNGGTRCSVTRGPCACGAWH